MTAITLAAASNETILALRMFFPVDFHLRNQYGFEMSPHSSPSLTVVDPRRGIEPSESPDRHGRHSAVLTHSRTFHPVVFGVRWCSSTAAAAAAVPRALIVDALSRPALAPPVVVLPRRQRVSPLPLSPWPRTTAPP